MNRELEVKERTWINATHQHLSEFATLLGLRVSDLGQDFCAVGLEKLTTEAVSIHNVDWKCTAKGLDYLHWDCGHHCIGDSFIRTKSNCESNGCYWKAENEYDAEEYLDECHCPPGPCLEVGGQLSNRRCELTHDHYQRKEVMQAHGRDGWAFHCDGGWHVWKTFSMGTSHV